MDIIPWGVRGSFPITSSNMQVYGGNTTCYEINNNESQEFLIIDAGTGIYHLSKQLPEQGIVHVLISHTHIDHIQGLPYFTVLFNPHWEVHLYTPQGSKHFIDDLFNGVFFPVKKDELSCKLFIHELNAENLLNLCGLQIEAPIVNHTCICHGFRLTASSGIVCILPDVEINNTRARDTVTYILRDADLAFVDGQYTEKEYKKRIGWGHSAMEKWVHIANKAKVKKIFISHHDNARTDKELDNLGVYIKKLPGAENLDIEFAKELTKHTLTSTEKIVTVYSTLNTINWITEFSQELLRYNDTSTILDLILREARRLTEAEAGTIYLVENSELVFAYTHNDFLFPVNNASKFSYANSRLPINQSSIAGYSAYTKKPLNISNVYKLPATSPYIFNNSFDKSSNYKTVSTFCLPLIGRNSNLLGIVQLINKLENNKPVPFPANTTTILSLLSFQAVNALERSMLAKEMIMRMQHIAALNDPKETGAHVERVGAVAAELYSRIAEKTNVPIDVRKDIRSQIRLAAMSHDLGKVSIPDRILKKPGKLDPEEILIMQKHCAIGGQLFHHTLESTDFMAQTIAIHHHQKWNGTGYTGSPDIPLLSGEDIPLEARLTAVADVFDALISVRCYKPAWTWEDATAVIRKDAGTHFDPAIVEAFFEIEETIKAIYVKYKDTH